jgi:hypothetical protein
MQFIQSKLFSKLLIIGSALVLLMVPVVAAYKAFNKNPENEDNLINIQNNPPAPEVIQKTEEVEEIEYVYITPEPTIVATEKPYVNNNNKSVREDNEYEDEEDED